MPLFDQGSPSAAGEFGAILGSWLSLGFVKVGLQ